jgi:lysophospholipase L1-like esterase
MTHRSRAAAAVALLATLVVLLAAASALAEQYVALGDSYSSGVGTRVFFEETCKRSLFAYPELIAAQRPNTSLVFAACTGAKTADVLNRQVPSLTSSTAIVTITIGGNDAGFSTVLGACVLLDDCVKSGAVAAADATIVTVLPRRLRSTYRAVEKAAPDADLVVVGYPRLFPRHQADVTGCPWLSNKERKALNASADLLNLEIRLAAWRTGARYVSVANTLAGHELCTKDSWIFPIGVGDQPQFWAHPILKGQQAIAARVAAALS